MKQKQEESRRESSKRPRADGFAPAVHHVLEHPNSAPHHSHQGQQFWKHNSFEGTESLNNTMNASLNDSSMLEGSFGKYSSAMPSPDAHQHPKHYQFLEQASGGTPGSALETVVANNTDNVGAGVARAHHDDDGVNSEITIETGIIPLFFNY